MCVNWRCVWRESRSVSGGLYISSGPDDRDQLLQVCLIMELNQEQAGLHCMTFAQIHSLDELTLVAKSQRKSILIDRLHRKSCSVWWVQSQIFYLQTLIPSTQTCLIFWGDLRAHIVFICRASYINMAWVCCFQNNLKVLKHVICGRLVCDDQFFFVSIYNVCAYMAKIIFLLNIFVSFSSNILETRCIYLRSKMT